MLLDVDLPDMNGFDVCRHLRGVDPRSAVIFLTSSSSVDEKVCGLHLGGVDYVTKPFDPAELAQRVRNSLRTKRLLERLPTPAAAGARGGPTGGGVGGVPAVRGVIPPPIRSNTCGGRFPPPSFADGSMRQRVLMIDDALPLHRVVEARLRGTDVELHSALDGATGLADAGTCGRASSCSTWTCPTWTGSRCAAGSRPARGTADIPVIFLTADGDGRRVRPRWTWGPSDT